MQDQSSSAQAAQSSSSAQTRRHSERTLWIITGYVGAGIVLLGVLAYYFSVYITH